MIHVDVLGSVETPAHAVYLEAEDGGVNPKTRVRAVFRDGAGFRETCRVFDTLEQALAYAHTLYPHAA
jgi:hypothetical protein